MNGEQSSEATKAFSDFTCISLCSTSERVNGFHSVCKLLLCFRLSGPMESIDQGAGAIWFGLLCRSETTFRQVLFGGNDT